MVWSPVSLLAFQGCSWKLISGTLRISTTNISGPVLIGLKVRALYMKTSQIFRLISAPIEGILPKIHFSQRAHIRWKVCWLQAVKSVKTLYMRTNVLFACISVYDRGALLKIQIWNTVKIFFLKNITIFVPRLVNVLFTCSEWKVPTLVLRWYRAPRVHRIWRLFVRRKCSRTQRCVFGRVFPHNFKINQYFERTADTPKDRNSHPKGCQSSARSVWKPHNLLLYTCFMGIHMSRKKVLRCQWHVDSEELFKTQNCSRHLKTKILQGVWAGTEYHVMSVV
jgi:hypothetical protein